MSLSIVNNVASLNAQHNLTKTNHSLNTSLERLSSGLKINRGADGPAALVISEQQRAQIAGLRAAIDNTSKAISVVQLGEGALNEINSLLLKVRSLAVDSSNTGANDANSLAANQAEINNALSTIDQIANNTQVGTRKLFNGSSGFDGTTTDTDVTFLKATSSAPTGLSAVVVSSAATRANVLGANAVGALATAETLTINGVAISLAAADNAAAVVNKINNFTAQTGVTAENAAGTLRLRTSTFGSAATFTVQSTVAAGANTTGIGTAAIVATGTDVAGTIGGVAGIGTGNVLTAQGITVSIGLDTVAPSTTTTVTGAQGSVNVVDRSLKFQIGAFAGQTASIAFDKLSTSSLGIGANGSGTANLAAVDVRSFIGAQDAIRVTDQAINDVTSLRGTLGAFQQNTLSSTANNLRTSLENTTASESVIRDTDYAEEISNFTRYQVQMQAGATVLGNANQQSQLINTLLRG
jgi:flagellin